MLSNKIFRYSVAVVNTYTKEVSQLDKVSRSFNKYIFGVKLKCMITASKRNKFLAESKMLLFETNFLDNTLIIFLKSD